MAAAIRQRIGFFARKFGPFSFDRSRYLQKCQACNFHTSTVLNVVGQEIMMPSLSPTMSDGTIVKWLKKEGDPVMPGDVLCDIQTDKAVVSLETDEAGILAKILVSENVPEVPVGTLIALMVGEGEDWEKVEFSATQTPHAESSSTVNNMHSLSEGSGSSPIRKPSISSGQIVVYGPAVRYLLERYDLKPNAIVPSGRNTRLLKEDVLKHVKEHNLKEKPVKQVSLPKVEVSTLPTPKKDVFKPVVKTAGSNFVELEISNIRKTIARRLSESKTNIPHSYASMESNITKLLELRKRLKTEGIGLSVNDFIIKASAQALQMFPEVNAHFIQDKAIHLPEVEISIAVATEAGLITPIITDVARKGLVEISASVRDLAIRARAGKLQPHEFQGGSFTISNLGMFGIQEFSAIINPPQVAILAVGTTTEILGPDGNPQSNMYITLSYDRRAFDEGVAAEFLKAIQTVLEDPTMMILGGHRDLQVELEG